ncbi:S9 family peptidase [Pontibacter sp. G13]|uniref:S9 family peptidase n=1 Tax=Pontibacter sp. G13 TaxID=3074898 RepID=UPI00288979DA|nr:S9 family peptidase [Pontibacter sp. G13]WNJ19467.1 S9 family peptidase [Pontibacter sp. G13]
MKRLLIAASALFVGALHAQPSDVLTPEKLWELGRVSLDDVSADGQHVIYGVSSYELSENKGNRDLYVIPAEGGKVRKITAFEGSEYNSRIHPAGNKIGFLSRESGSTQLWEMNLDGSDKHQVSHIEGGVTGFEYAPSGDRVLFTKVVKLDQTVQDIYPDLPHADARIIDDLMYRHWDEWHDYSYSHIFVSDYEDGELTGELKDIMEGERFDAPLNPFGGIEQIAFSPNGYFIAYTSKKVSGKEYATSTDSDIYLYDVQGDKTTNLTDGMDGYDMEPVFSPNGQLIAWNSMETPGFESDRNRIFVMNLSGGDKRELTVGLDRDANHPHWSQDGETIYCLTGEQATYQLASINVETADFSMMTSGDHNYTSFGVTEKGLVASRMDMSTPTELFFVDKKGESAQITFTNEAMLKSLKMGNIEKRMIETTDGEQMLTWVIYPPNFDPKKKYPTLLYCQGGPQSAVSQFFSYRWNFQLMAANDYIIVAPNRRGLPSFGRKWNDEISGDWGGQAMEDYLSAIDAVAEEDFVDNDNLGAIGASYGGYSVYWLAGNHDKRFKTFISHCGLFNLESWYATTEELFFANQDIGGAYWEVKPNPSYKLHSPHLYVGNWDSPILVIHGEKDFRVPVGEGMQAFNAAQIQDIPSRFLYFPNEGHWVLSPQNGVLWHRVFFEWLDQWLKTDDMAAEATEEATETESEDSTN